MARIVKAPEERRSEILDYAQQLFLERGYERTTVQDVVKRAQVSQGTFYYYFPTKESVLEALAERLALRVAAETETLAEDDTLAPLDRLNRLLAETRRLKIQAAATHGELFRALLRAENIVFYHRVKGAVFAAMTPPLTRIIRDGVKSGAFNTPDARRSAEALLQMSVTLRDAYLEMFRADTDDEKGRAASNFEEAVDFYAITVDRILGLPEGSTRFMEAGFARRLIGG